VTDDLRDRGRAVPLADELEALGPVRNSTVGVYSLLRNSGPMTRAEMDQALPGMTISTIDKSMRTLREKGLLAETDYEGPDANRQYFIDPRELSFL
jgi:predicted transcriptional regulator